MNNKLALKGMENLTGISLATLLLYSSVSVSVRRFFILSLSCSISPPGDNVI
jgi:hypothetical protein